MKLINKKGKQGKRKMPKELKQQRAEKKRKGNQSHEQILQQIQQLERCIENQSISSISLFNEQYYGKQRKRKTDSPHLKINQQEMVIVPKQKLLRLFHEVKTLKGIIKSREAKITDELESLRKGVRNINGEKLLLTRQQQYLRDMNRAASETKTQYYQSTPNFYASKQRQ